MWSLKDRVSVNLSFSCRAILTVSTMFGSAWRKMALLRLSIRLCYIAWLQRGHLRILVIRLVFLIISQCMIPLQCRQPQSPAILVLEYFSKPTILFSVWHRRKDTRSHYWWQFHIETYCWGYVLWDVRRKWKVLSTCALHLVYGALKLLSSNKPYESIMRDSKHLIAA